MEHFPQDLLVTIEDFRKSKWREAIQNAGDHGYSSYWDSFSKYARQATASNDIPSCKILWLFADACSMKLNPEGSNVVFQPIFIVQGKRSAIPEDFTKEDIVFFETTLPEIDDYRLKARIADILWLIRKPKEVAHAYTAIESYSQFPLDANGLIRDSKESWHRAISLARLLGRGSGDRIENIVRAIHNEFLKTDFSEKFHCLWLAELLEISYLDEDILNTIGPKLEAYAQAAKGTQDWNCARRYYEEAIKWFKRAADLEKINELHIEIAETYVLEAESKIAGANPSHMLAGQFFELAIHEFRKIPTKDRAAYKIDERIAENHKRMAAANKIALTEMTPIETPGIDTTQMVEASKKHVADRSLQNALIAFAYVARTADYEQIRSSAVESSKKFIFRQLFGSTHMTRDGRIAARSSGFSIENTDEPETPGALWESMLQYYNIHVSLSAQANILPALHIINLEHRITERYLESMCQHSQLIPEGRVGLWAKGLFFGFEKDFVISTHLLIPQIEHVVRCLMKIKGLKTTCLDSDGIETENGLGNLLNHAEIEKALEKNLIFELKALLTDPIGPNLRNETAHGLLEEDGARSAAAVYLWWLCLNIIIKSVLPTLSNGTREKLAD